MSEAEACWRAVPRSGRALGARAAAAAIGLALWAAWLPGAALGACANDAVRVQQETEGLPDCRAYEFVSLPEKNVFDVAATNDGTLAESDGDAVVYQSFGAFGGQAPVWRNHTSRDGPPPERGPAERWFRPRVGRGSPLLQRSEGSRKISA